MTQTVLIAGAGGKTGRHAAAAFAAAGWQVRRYRRGTDMVRAAQGAQVIVNGMNPPAYQNWAKNIPAITAQVIEAARSSGATVILPGNVYNFGRHCPGAWDERSVQDPNTRKGRIRVEMEAAYLRSGVQTIVLRAGNFIAPDGDDDVLQLVHLRSLESSKLVLPGPPEVRQAWAYMPDWAQAAVGLAEIRGSLGALEDVPYEGYTLTGTELQDRLERLTGHSLRVASFPWWAMNMLSPFWELAREMAEMRYLYELDHALSGAKLKRLLPEFVPTPVDAALAATLKIEVQPDQPVTGCGLDQGGEIVV